MWSLEEVPTDRVYEMADNLIICTPKTHVLEPDENSLPPLKLGPKIRNKIPFYSDTFDVSNPMMESPSKPPKVVGQEFPAQIWNELGMVSPLLSFSDDETLSDNSSIISPASDNSSVSSSSPDLGKTNLYRNFLDIGDLGLLPASNAEEQQDLPLQLFISEKSEDKPEQLYEEEEEEEEADSEEAEYNSISKKRSSKQPFECLKRKCQPRHAILHPSKSSLKLRPNALNFVMHSSNGSIKDATIFATEINSCNGYGVPFPSSVMERVTIPVNTQIKEHYKNEKGKQLDGYYDEDDDSGIEGEAVSCEYICDAPPSDCLSLDNSPDDSAIIRAFEFERLVTFSEKCDVCTDAKQVKWLADLEC